MMRKLCPTVPVAALAVLGLVAYTYSEWTTQLSNIIIGPAVAHEALRALVIGQILRSFAQRWADFTASSRVGWALVLIGLTLNLARDHYAYVPLTLSAAITEVGLVVITWRLMAVTRREKRLAHSLDESEQIRLDQDEVIQDLQDDLHRVGQQSKEFELRARAAEQRLSALGDYQT